MKKLTTILTITLSIFLIGCFALPNSQYNEMMTNGKSAVIEGDYDKAINYFKLALEQKSGDNEATNLIDQLEILSGITKEQQDEDIDVYIHKLENIDNINDIKTKTSLVKNEFNRCKEILKQYYGD